MMRNRTIKLYVEKYSKSQKELLLDFVEKDDYEYVLENISDNSSQ